MSSSSHLFTSPPWIPCGKDVWIEQKGCIGGIMHFMWSTSVGIQSTMMSKTPHFSPRSYEPKESTHVLIHHDYIWLHLLWCIRNTYILINREATQEIYIILTNTLVLWSWSLQHHQDYILCTVLCCTHWLRPCYSQNHQYPDMGGSQMSECFLVSR